MYWKHGFILLALALVCAGCQNTVNTVENADKNMTPAILQDTRIITDKALRDRLAIRNLTVARTPAGQMRAQLEVTNVRTGIFAQLWSSLTGENPYPFRYKFVWFMQDGMAAGTVLSDWQDAVAAPGETLYLQSVAPDKNCADVKISIREAK